MALSDTAIEAAARMVKQAAKILITSHIRPDGDAVGSLIGLGLALEQSGKSVEMVIDDGVPSSLRHLEGSERLQRRAKENADLVITLDCSEAERAGKILKNQIQVGINIDHHITNQGFGLVNLIDPEASATSEIIVDILPRFELQLSRYAAEALMTGLITDTLGFRTSNVSPHTMRIAAKLLETGIDMPEIYQRALLNRSFEAAKFWGAGLTRLERQGRLVWTSLRMADREAAKYPGRDDADLINVLSSLDDIDIALIFVEQPNGNIKVSWRAQTDYDVSKIALQFGGGGHAAAAGAEIIGDLAEVQKTVLKKTRSLISGGESV